MRTGVLTATLDLSRIGPERTNLAADLPTRDMQRLAAAAALPETVSAHVSTVRDGGGNVVLGLTATAQVGMTCQRCLENVYLELEAHAELIAVTDERATAEADGKRDAVVAPMGRLDVITLVEDELLLALPPVPRHPTERDCAPESRQFGPAGSTAAPQRENPFAVLAQLRRGEDPTEK